MMWWLIAVGIYLLLVILALLFKRGINTTCDEKGTEMLLQCPVCHVYYVCNTLGSQEFFRCDCSKKKPELKIVHKMDSAMKMKIIQKGDTLYEV